MKLDRRAKEQCVLEKLPNQNEQLSNVFSMDYVTCGRPYDGIKLQQNGRNVEQYMVQHIVFWPLPKVVLRWI